MSETKKYTAIRTGEASFWRITDDENGDNILSVHDIADQLNALTAQLAAMQAALEKIGRWQGEFPHTEQFHADGTEMSYGWCYGSNGERDYMRQIARQALEVTK